MALIEDFESSGQWLFRWRSYLPLFLLLFFALSLRHFHYFGTPTLDQLWELSCLLVSSLGLGIRVLVVGFTPKGTSGRNTKTQIAYTLNTSGAYSVVRNPLYLGNYIMGLGVALFAYQLNLVLLYTAAFWLYYERIIFAEECFLKKKFGETFNAWARQTPVFIPNFSQFRKPCLPFSLKNVLKREYNGFLTILVSLFFLETVGDFFLNHKFQPDLPWSVCLGVGFSVWVVLRYLRKKSTFLNVEGR